MKNKVILKPRGSIVDESNVEVLEESIDIMSKTHKIKVSQAGGKNNLILGLSQLRTGELFYFDGFEEKLIDKNDEVFYEVEGF